MAERGGRPGEHRCHLGLQPVRIAFASGTRTAAPAPTSASALRVWWSRGAPGSGTRMAGMPATSSSATVMAPARQTNRRRRPGRSRASDPRRPPPRYASPAPNPVHPPPPRRTGQVTRRPVTWYSERSRRSAHRPARSATAALMRPGPSEPPNAATSGAPAGSPEHRPRLPARRRCGPVRPSSGRTGVPSPRERGRSVPGKATALPAAKRPSRPLTAPGHRIGVDEHQRVPGDTAARPAGKLA
jgi:hypothetical protein